MNDRDNRLVKLAEMWERTSGKGTKYFSGFLGPCSLVMFDAGEQDHPTKPGEKVHVWKLFVQEGDPERRPARRGQQTNEAVRDRAGEIILSKKSRDEYQAELASRFRPDEGEPF